MRARRTSARLLATEGHAVRGGRAYATDESRHRGDRDDVGQHADELLGDDQLAQVDVEVRAERDGEAEKERRMRAP